MFQHFESFLHELVKHSRTLRHYRQKIADNVIFLKMASSSCYLTFDE